MLMINFCYFDPEVKFRHLWSIFSTPDFSRRRMPSCICWGSRFVIIFATWTHRSLELIVINCLYFNFSRQVSKLAWLQSVRLMLLISFATWTRRSLELIVIDCLYFSSSRQVSKLAWLQLVRLMLVMIFRYLDPLVNFRYLSSHMWSSFTTWTHRSLSLLVIHCLHFKLKQAWNAKLWMMRHASLPEGCFSKPRRQGSSIDSISWIDCITSNPMTRSRSRCNHFWSKDLCPKASYPSHRLGSPIDSISWIDCITSTPMTMSRSRCNHFWSKDLCP